VFLYTYYIYRCKKHAFTLLRPIDGAVFQRKHVVPLRPIDGAVFQKKHVVPLRPIDGAVVPKKSMFLPLSATGVTSIYISSGPIYKLRANLLNCAV
jgi:hypothetical protein